MWTMEQDDVGDIIFVHRETQVSDTESTRSSPERVHVENPTKRRAHKTRALLVQVDLHGAALSKSNHLLTTPVHRV